MRLSLAIGFTLSSAMLLGLAFPPHGLRLLAFVGLVPFLLASRSGGVGRAVGLGWLFGVAYGWATAYFFPGSIAAYYDRPLWFGLLAGMAIFTSMASLYYMAFAAIDHLLVRRFPLIGSLLSAATWVSVELGRGTLFTGSDYFIGNPWGLLGYTHASGSLAQIASWTGVYGISFAIVLVNTAIAGWITAWRGPKGASRAATLSAVAAMMLTLGLVVSGAVLLRAAPDASSRDGLLEVAVVQGNVSIERRWRSDSYGKNLDVYLGLTQQALGAGSPRLILWPESAMNFFLESEPHYREAIARVLRAGNVELLAGGPGQDGPTRPPVFNSVFRLSSEGAIVSRYDKQILMPFSEYFPFGSHPLMRRRMEGARTFTAGATQLPPLDTPLGRAGMLICNEAMFPELAAARVRHGAEILLNPSNDGWINGEGFGEHMLAVVGLRAIEQRRYLVRASTSGPSAVIDPWGRVAVRTPGGSRHLMRGGVRAEEGLTVYGRFGDTFAVACLLVALAALAGLTISARPDRR